MRLCKQSLSVILVVLLLFLTADFAAAEITNNTTNISNSITSGGVAGNSGTDNIETDFINDPNIPQPGNDEHVYSNHVIIHSTGSVTGSAYGGFTYGHGNVYDNTVSVDLNGFAGEAYGGMTAGDGVVNGNRVEISGSADTAIGGATHGAGNATSNDVVISGTANMAYGGMADVSGSVTNNRVTIDINGTVSDSVYGGRVNNSNSAGIVSGNNVIIESGGTADSAYGGVSNGIGNVNSNTVILADNGKVTQEIYGGLIMNANSAGMVSGNSITIGSNGSADSVYGGNSNGSGVVSSNIVIIDGSVTDLAYGSYSDGTGSVENNSITLGVTGKATDVYGGYISNANSAGAVSGNTVTMNGEAVTIIGGISNGSGKVSSNIVVIDGLVTYLAYGGYADGTGSVENNAITIGNNGNAGEVYGGYVNNTNNASAVSGNTVTISGEATQTIGGMSNGSGLVNNNRVVITGSATQVVGGRSYGSGNVSSNIVEIYGEVTGLAFGGYSSDTGSVENNTITVGTNGKADGVYGGYINNGNSAGAVSGNTVIISGNAVEVVGGSSHGSGKVSSNIVEIYGKVTGVTFGGNSSGSGSVENNSITVGANANATDVFGGIVFTSNSSGSVIGNRVTINGNATDVFGGTSTGSGNVSGNMVEINGTVSDSIYGGSSSGTGSVENNTITIGANGNADEAFGGRIYNPSSAGAVNGNTVIISGKANQVWGGNSNSSGSVSSNIVKISGAVSGYIYGGFSDGTGNVTQNRVEIESGNQSAGQTPTVYGGIISNLLSNGNVADNTVVIGNNSQVAVVFGGNSSGLGNVTGNTVTIRGTVLNEVYGGHATSLAKVENNTVNIAYTAHLTGASVYGSNLSGVVGTGNTLNVDRFSGSMQTIVNFEHYNFVMGRLGGSDGLTYIEITGTAVNLNDSNITISFAPEFFNNITLNPGDVITVISKINANAAPEKVTLTPSSYIVYDFIEKHDNNKLVLTLVSMALSPQISALGEGFAAGLAFLGQAADVRSSIYFAPQGPRFIPFAKMIYGKQYISTGSSINVKGFSAIAGLALNTNFDNGSQLVVGAFVEGGWGDYDSRNSFSNSARVKSKGDTEYYGGGVLARYALKSGLYGEGTFAAGKTETDFRTRDFAPGTRSKYDYSVPYYSAHVAVGQVLNLSERLSLDVYGKYLWTRQAGDNVTVDGYRFKFKDADSHRVRVGGKLQADVSSQLQPYVGGAYEYEFSGEIKGSLRNMHMDKPSLRGGTGIGELGLVWTPNDAQNLRVDLGMQGYVGKREGVSGGLTVSLSF